MDNPVREIRTVIQDGGGSYTNRIFVGTPATGLVRVEWMVARYSQIIPVNWSQVQFLQYMNGYIPMRYQVDDAQNLIVKDMLDKDFEWLFLLEHDNIIPDNTLVMLDEYMSEAKYPIVSGLYYTRSRPSKPLVFRGRGNGVYTDWQMGDKVWVDGVPTGCLLIHHSILRLMWDESPEYIVRVPSGTHITRRVFRTPRDLTSIGGLHSAVSGTSDLHWCDRILNEDVLKRAGWGDFAPDMRYPFLIDTNIFSRHINMNGEQFP